MAYRPLDDDTRAAVEGAFSAGLGVNDIARMYHIGKATVSRWVSKLDKSTLEQYGTEREVKYKEKVAEVAIAILNHVKCVAEETGKAEYIRTQTAADLSKLADTFFDQLCRIFEASEPEDNGNQAGQLEAAVIPGADNPGGQKRD